MSRETTEKVASDAGRLLNINAPMLRDWLEAEPDACIAAVHAVAGSALAQREDDPLDEDSFLSRIAGIIEQVDVRCMAADGPVTPTPLEITQEELSRIYALSKRRPEDWRP